MQHGDIGSLVRRRRAELHLTLSELAKRSGVSASMLSDIEGGRKSPTIRTVFQIASGLACTISELLDLPPAVQVERQAAGERQVLTDAETGVERHLLSPLLVRRGIQVLLYRLPPGASTGAFPPDRPGAIEHVTALSGRLIVRLDETTYPLKEGDSMTHPADTNTEIQNASEGWAELLMVVDQTGVGRA